MENLISHIYDFIKHFDVKAENNRTKSKKRWLLNKNYLEPLSDSDEEDTSVLEKSENNNLKNKAKCLYEAAKYGTQEGVLTGVFFGGSWGILKFISLQSFSSLLNSSKENATGRKFSKESDKSSNIVYSSRYVGNTVSPKNKSGFGNNKESFRQSNKYNEDSVSAATKSSVSQQNPSNMNTREKSRSSRTGKENLGFLNEFDSPGKSSYEDITNNSKILRSKKNSEKVEIVGYAFIQSGSFEDSDERQSQSDDPGPTKDTSAESQKKKKSDNSSHVMKSKKSSKDSQSSSKQSSKSGGKSSTSNNVEILSKQLGKSYAATSTSAASRATFTSLLKVSETTKTENVSVSDYEKSSRIKSQSSSKNGSLLTTSKGTIKKSELSSQIPGSQPSQNLSVISDKEEKIKLTSVSNQAITSSEPSLSGTSDHLFKSASNLKVNIQKEPNTFSQSIISEKKSANRQKQPSRTTDENIWPGRDMSKSIIRNADSISNGVYSADMDNRSEQFQAKDENYGINDDTIFNNPSNISEIGKETSTENSVLVTESEESEYQHVVSDDSAVIAAAHRSTIIMSQTDNEETFDTGFKQSSATVKKLQITDSEKRFNEVSEKMTGSSGKSYSGRATSSDIILENSNIDTRAGGVSSETASEITKQSQKIFGTNVNSTSFETQQLNVDSNRVVLAKVRSEADESSGRTDATESNLINTTILETSFDSAAFLGNGKGYSSQTITIGAKSEMESEVGGTATQSVKPSQIIIKNDSSSAPKDSEPSYDNFSRSVEHEQSAIFKNPSENQEVNSIRASGTGASEPSRSVLMYEESRPSSRIADFSNVEKSLDNSKESISSGDSHSMESFLKGVEETADSNVMHEVSRRRDTFTSFKNENFVPYTVDGKRSTDASKYSAKSEKIREDDDKDEENASNKFNLFSVINDNIIVLSACNCALVLGVVCGVISTTKASLKI